MGHQKKKEKKKSKLNPLGNHYINLARPKFCFPKRKGDKFGIPQGGFN